MQEALLNAGCMELVVSTTSSLFDQNFYLFNENQSSSDIYDYELNHLKNKQLLFNCSIQLGIALLETGNHFSQVIIVFI